MLWGAFGVTLFGIFLTPVFFYVIRRFAGQPTRAPVPAEGRNRALQAVPSVNGAGSLKEMTHG
jgi:hypothetical protein